MLCPRTDTMRKRRRTRRPQVVGYVGKRLKVGQTCARVKGLASRSVGRSAVRPSVCLYSPDSPRDSELSLAVCAALCTADWFSLFCNDSPLRSTQVYPGKKSKGEARSYFSPERKAVPFAAPRVDDSFSLFTSASVYASRLWIHSF